ncbi:MAG: transposase [Myxacorys chilensis ATA2-1-KO14]|nr:transposase [Myxacorys chilensis ATA2-1-KO14]
MIQSAGANVILPPYSPEFSPIENCWSKIKSVLRSLQTRTHPDLVKAGFAGRISLRHSYWWGDRSLG